MESREIKQDIKLGVFVLTGVLLFLVAVFYLGSESNVFRRTFVVSAVFRNVEGLKSGDNVWLSGVKIGTVKDVRIISEGHVIVDLSLRENQTQFIKNDATASIGSDGLVGSKIVVIRPGSVGSQITHADTINSISPADTQELLNIAKDVGQNTRDITAELKSFVEKIGKGTGVIGELVNDGPLAQDIRNTIATLKQTGNNAARASSQLNTLTYNLQHGDGLLPTLISDTSYEQVFRDAIVNVRTVSENSAAMARDLEEVVAKMNDENNAVGVLLADTAFANKLQKTLDNAQDASAKLDENMEALQHNFLLRGYFRKKERREEREAEKARERESEISSAY